MGRSERENLNNGIGLDLPGCSSFVPAYAGTGLWLAMGLGWRPPSCCLWHLWHMRLKMLSGSYFLARVLEIVLSCIEFPAMLILNVSPNLTHPPPFSWQTKIISRKGLINKTSGYAACSSLPPSIFCFLFFPIPFLFFFSPLLTKRPLTWTF